MIKCTGCGVEFIDSDLDKNLCERCFRIKHYNDYKKVTINEQDFINIINNINKESLILLVIDAFDMPKDLNIFKSLNNVLLVINKRDLLPLSFNDNKLLEYVNDYDIDLIDKVIISNFKNYNFDNLYELIYKYKKGNNVYVVGFTNSGKSTMINKLIYNYTNQDIELTTSIMPSTTLNNIEIKFNNDLTLIDTPGIIDVGSLTNYISENQLKKISTKKTPKPITYQIKTKQSILIEDFLIIDVLDKTDLTMYFSNNLNIERIYSSFETDLKENEFLIVDNSDIVIKGLGFINIRKKCRLKIYTLADVEVFIRKSIFTERKDC